MERDAIRWELSTEGGKIRVVPHIRIATISNSDKCHKSMLISYLGSRSQTESRNIKNHLANHTRTQSYTLSHRKYVSVGKRPIVVLAPRTLERFITVHQ